MTEMRLPRSNSSNRLSHRTLHTDEIHTDVDLVRTLLVGQFPQWADFPLEPVLSAGTDNALYRLGDDMVVRLPRIHWAVEDVDKEHQWLPRLAPLLPIAIPVPLGKGKPAKDYPWHWSVYRWPDREHPVLDCSTDFAFLAKDLGDFVATLQCIDPAGGPPASRGVPLEERDDSTRTAIDALGGLIYTAAVTAAWESALQAPPRLGAPVWVTET